MFGYPQFADVLAVAAAVSAVLRGGKITAADGAKACWVVAGYGLSVALPVASAAKSKQAAAKLTRKKAAALLENLSAARGAKRHAGIMDAVPWGRITELLLPLLLEWLAKRKTG